MKRFLFNVCLAAIFAALLSFAALSARIMVEQCKVRNEFTIPPDVEVLCVGNSHTACTWTQASEFKNKKLSSSSSTTMSSLMRLREVERCGGFANVKIVLADLDAGGLRYESEIVERTFMEQMAFSWRYLNLVPLPKCKLALHAISMLTHHWLWRDPVKYDDDGKPRYVDRDEATRRMMLTMDFDFSDANTRHCANWEAAEKQIIREMKEICDKNHVRLVFFAGPLVAGHRDRKRGDGDPLAPWVSYAESLGVEYIDLRESCPDDWFRDTNHLLSNRTYDFTKRVWSEYGFKRGM